MSDTPSQGTSVCPENWSKSNRLMRRLLLLWAGGIGTELIVFFIGPPIVLHFVPWEVWRESVAIWWLGGIGILTVIWFGACLGGICLGARMKTHVRETLRNQDRTAIGCWVDVLPSLTSYMWQGSTNNEFIDGAREALIACLPDVTAEEAPLFSDAQRRTLYRILTGTDSPLILAVLQALPHVGDERALPYVQSLAAGKGAMRTEHEPIRSAAQQCLLLLQANLAHKRNPDTLLRASRVPATGPEELLRPSQETGVSETQQLLRPDTSD